MDSLYYDLISEMFDMAPFIPTVPTYGLTVFSSIFICVIVLVKKRRKRNKINNS